MTTAQANSLNNGFKFSEYGHPQKQLPSIIPLFVYDNKGNCVGFTDNNFKPVISSKKVVTSGASICDWQVNTGVLSLVSAGAASSAALDTTVVLNGKPTLKCTFSTAVDTFIARFVPTNPISVPNIKALQIPILFTSNQTANGGVGATATPFQVWLTTSNGKVIRAQCRFEYIQSAVWNSLSFSRATAYITNNTLAELDTPGVTITNIQIVQATTAAANSNPVWIGEVFADSQVNKGRISIILDGNYISQYSVMASIFRTNRIIPSLAVVATQLDVTGGALPCMTSAQMNELVSFGYEPICHTYEATPGTGFAVKTGGYANAAQWPVAADIATDIRNMWALFNTYATLYNNPNWLNGIGYSVHGYSNPYDPAVATARQALVTAGFKGAGVQAIRKSGGYAGETNAGVVNPVINLPNMPIDPYSLVGSLQVTNTTTFAEIDTLLNQCELLGQWVLITLHRTSVAPGSLECLSSLVQYLAEGIALRVDRGTVICAPFGETYNELFH